ncbi:KAP family P-loop NTPase fold protein [Actinotignum sp. GS-2025a]|uniref:KAP family P-loop NTPase fold protein n=1 Tax=Actinotignum sp. GS-2025a TaxID=3427274 RepID=UPI003F473789
MEVVDQLKTGIDSVKSSQTADETSDLTRSISDLRTALQELVDSIVTAGEHGEPLAKRLFVFIDDLDRLEPARAVEVMEALKVFLNIKGCVFVLAIDFSVVASGVKAKYGNDFQESKARAFFDKIIQIPFNLPVGSYSIEGLLGEGLKAIGIEIDREGPEFEGFRNLVLFSVGTNPRSIKRLINTFGLLKTIQDVSVKTENGKNKYDTQLSPESNTEARTSASSVEGVGSDSLSREGERESQLSPLDLLAALAFQTAFPQIFEDLMREMLSGKEALEFLDDVKQQLSKARTDPGVTDQLEEWGIDHPRIGSAAMFFKEFMNHFAVPSDKKKGSEDVRAKAAQRIADALGVAAVTAVGAGDIADSALRRSGASVLEDLDTRLREMPAKFEKVKELLEAFDGVINYELGEGSIVAGDTGTYWSYASNKPELLIDTVKTKRFCAVYYFQNVIRVEFGSHLAKNVFLESQENAKAQGFNISIRSSAPGSLTGIATVEEAKKAAKFIADVYRRK